MSATDHVEWERLIASYEAHLDVQEAALAAMLDGHGDAGDDPVAPPDAFVVPARLPVPPAHLHAELERVQRRTEALAARCSDSLADRPPLPSPRRRPASPSSPLRLDRRA